MEKSSMIHQLTSKSLPLVRLFLSVKSRTTSSFFFFLLLVVIKFLGILIMFTSFTSDWTSPFAFKVSSTLRTLTVFGWMSNMDFSAYLALCLVLFLLLLFCFAVTFYFYSQTKKREKFLTGKAGNQLSLAVATIFHILLLLSQHLLEVFSFIYMISFNTGGSDTLGGQYSLFNYLNLNATEKYKGWVLVIVNTCSILMLNIFIYYSYTIVNEPFFDTTFPVQLRHTSKSATFIFMVITNLQCIHYFELFVSTAGSLLIYKYIIIAAVNSLLIFKFVRSYRSFQFENFFTYFVEFVLSFCVLSSILDLILYLTGNTISNLKSLIFILVCKLLLTTSFVILNNLIVEKLFVRLCRVSLFKIYDGKISGNDLESLYFVINLLINLRKERVEDLGRLMNIILNHKAECGLDYCKCNIILNYKPAHLSYDINFILEGIFTNLNLGKDAAINVLFSEYLFYMKKSTLFSYAVLNTFISKNVNSSSSLQIFTFYMLQMKKVKEYESQLIGNSEYFTFHKVYDSISIKNYYQKKLNTYLENYEQFVNFKEKFDNSLKLNHNDSKIDSFIFETSLDTLVTSCRKNKSLYQKMKANIKSHFQNERCRSTELSYQLYLFFLIFNRKMPSKISPLIFTDSALDYDNSHAIQKYFNSSFTRYFLDKKSPQNIVIEVNKMFKIKYFSYNLSQTLGLNYSKLIGDDLHIIFPEQLREPHKKLLLNNFLIKKQTYFIKKSFAFTAGNNIVPIDLKVGCFPSLDKSLQAIVSTKLIEETPEEKKIFHFVLSEHYELLALSENLEANFSINYELIEKLNISVLKLFDIVDLIPKKFKSQLDKIAQYKKKKQMEALYSLSHFLFNLNQEDEINAMNNPAHDVNSGAVAVRGIPQSLFTNVKDLKAKVAKQGEVFNTFDAVTTNSKATPGFPGADNLNVFTPHSPDPRDGDTPGLSKSNLLKKSISRVATKNLSVKLKSTDKTEKTQSSNKLDDMSDLKDDGETSSYIFDDADKKKEEFFTVVRDRRLVITNLEKLKNKCQDMEVGQLFFKKLCEAIRLLKKSEEDQGEDSEKCERNRTYRRQTHTDVFKLKIHFRKINDAPFFIISVKEKKVLNKKFLDKGSIANQTSEFIKKVPNSRKLSKFTGIQSNNVFGPNPTNKPDEEDDKELHETNLLSPAFLKHRKKPCSSKVNKKMTNMLGYDQTLGKNEEKTQKQAKRVELTITSILAVLLIINISVSASVFYMKMYSLEATQALFTNKQLNKDQEAAFLSLHSGIITYLLTLTNLTSFHSDYTSTLSNFAVNDVTIQTLVNSRAANFREKFSKFFDYSESSSHPLADVESILYNSPMQFTRTRLTWDALSYSATFSAAADYICYNSVNLSLDPNLESLKSDIHLGLLFDRYTVLKGVSQHSTSAGVIYFLSRNFMTVENAINQIDATIDAALTNIRSSFRSMTLIVEIVSIFFSVILIFFIYYVLNKYDESLFRVILCMFLNLRKDHSADFKTANEVNLLKYRLKVYKSLIQSFTQTNIKEFDELIYIEDASQINLVRQAKAVIINSSSRNVNRKAEVPGKADSAVTDGHLPLTHNLYAALNPPTHSSVLPSNNSSVNPLNINTSSLANSPIGALNAGNKLDIITSAILGDKNDESHNLKGKKAAKKERTEKETPLEVDSLITNGHVTQNTTHHSINFVKIAKLLIIVIFLIYILFIVVNMIVSSFYFSDIDKDISLVTALVVKFPAMMQIYNRMRLAVIHNDGTLIRNYSDYVTQFASADAYYDNLSSTFRTKMPTLGNYVTVMDSKDYAQRASLICKGDFSQLCQLLLNANNGFNREGLRLSAQTALQTLSNIHKDWTKLSAQKDAVDVIRRYFGTTDFANVNLDSEFVFHLSSKGILSAINTDMDYIFASTINLSLMLGVLSICLNLVIIIYLVCGFFTRIKVSMKFIEYSAKKFNRALFDNSYIY